MYAIIYWEDDITVKPYLNDDGTLCLIEKISIAAKVAFELEYVLGVDARVISIEGVDE